MNGNFNFNCSKAFASEDFGFVSTIVVQKWPYCERTTMFPKTDHIHYAKSKMKVLMKVIVSLNLE
jgi:hypothetical protein